MPPFLDLCSFRVGWCISITQSFSGCNVRGFQEHLITIELSFSHEHSSKRKLYRCIDCSNNLYSLSLNEHLNSSQIPINQCFGDPQRTNYRSYVFCIQRGQGKMITKTKRQIEWAIAFWIGIGLMSIINIWRVAHNNIAPLYSWIMLGVSILFIVICAILLKGKD